MSFYHISANDLDEDEVNYELSIRGYPIDDSLETRLRTCRKVLREVEGAEVRTTMRSIEEEFHVVSLKLSQLEELIGSGVRSGIWSRLVHLHKRIRRYWLDKPEQLGSQTVLLDAITRMSKKYFDVDLNAIGYDVPVMRLVPITVTGASGFGPSVRQPQPVPGRTSEAAVQEGCGLGAFPKQRTMSDDLIMFSPVPDVNAEERRQTFPAVANKRISFENPVPPKQPALPPVPSSAAQPCGGENYVLGTPQYRSSIEFPRRRNFEIQKASFNPTTSSTMQHSCGPSFSHEHPPSVGAVGDGIGHQERDVSSQHMINPWMQSNIGKDSPPVWQQLPLAAGSPESVARENAPPTDAYSSVPRLDPVGNRRNGDEFIRVSEIEQYIQKYLEQKVPRASTVGPMVADDLANRMANLGVSNAAQSSRVLTEQTGSHFVPRLSLEPPLRLLTNASQFVGPAMPSRIQIPLVNEEAPTIPRMYQHSFVPTIPPAQRSVSSPRMPYEQYRNRLPHHTCNIIEKWPKFSGDSNPVPVVDFLRQIDILSRSYQISSQELRIHAHLLFKDDAYVWFTAYEGKMDSWETLLTYLKMRYDNPNRDRFIREEMRNRKQRPNELFSAYLTDLEAMSQRMMRKMSDEEKFDIIVENMKLSYKRRLALEPVYSVEHLAQLCYKFDALEANLFNIRSANKPSLLNQIVVEEELSDPKEESDEVDLLAIHPKTNRSAVRNTSTSKEPVRESADSNLCWNCRETGHMWRDCCKRKTIFCHICGNADTTAYQCPQNHNLRPRQQNDSKNE